MSNRYKGGIISATPPTTTGGESGVASGSWTLEQQFQAQGAGNWPTPATGPWIEDCFSTYLYTGTSAAQSIVNGIDESGKGALTWIKPRSFADIHALFDTSRGAGQLLQSQSTAAQDIFPTTLTSFNSNGFSLGVDGAELVNKSGRTYASWTFRKQPKFYTQGTFSGNGTSQTISHDLGSAPGCIFIKRTDASAASSWWAVYHRSLSNPNNNYLRLDSTNAAGDYGGAFISNVTSTSFDVSDSGAINISGGSYVYYAFAHDAGGFGLTGTDNVISCGSVTADGSGSATVNLGYEPQWILIKSSSAANSWGIVDTMRGLPADGLDRFLFPNNSNAESGGGLVNINATGFYANATLSASATYIYIAIRRGPMKVPTDATKVFSPIATTASTGTTLSTNFPIDMQIWAGRTSSYALTNSFYDRLRGVSTTESNQNSPYLLAPSTDAEATTYATTQAWSNTGFNIASIFSSLNSIYWNFRRAPSFFDEVCYTGTYPAVNEVNHNLGVAPELIINKSRSAVANSGWPVYAAPLGISAVVRLNSTSAVGGSSGWNDQPPTATQFFVNGYNTNGVTYVAYLFATCPGVSKVGSYTGTAATLQIDCGFTGGARFVLIKRTDSTGDWYVWDSARGIVAGNDPYSLLNSTAAEVANTDYVDTYSAGFEITSTAPAGINANGGTYIFLAIA